MEENNKMNVMSYKFRSLLVLFLIVLSQLSNVITALFPQYKVVAFISTLISFFVALIFLNSILILINEKKYSIVKMLGIFILQYSIFLAGTSYHIKWSEGYLSDDAKSYLKNKKLEEQRHAILLESQLKERREYELSHNIVLKGPIINGIKYFQGQPVSWPVVGVYGITMNLISRIDFIDYRFQSYNECSNQINNSFLKNLYLSCERI